MTQLAATGPGIQLYECRDPKTYILSESIAFVVIILKFSTSSLTCESKHLHLPSRAAEPSRAERLTRLISERPYCRRTDITEAQVCRLRPTMLANPSAGFSTAFSRAFPVTGAAIWNSLPPDIRHRSSSCFLPVQRCSTSYDAYGANVTASRQNLMSADFSVKLLRSNIYEIDKDDVRSLDMSARKIKILT
jgi:hypothetical protein